MIRMRHLADEIAALLKAEEKLLKEVAFSEEHTRKMKQEMGIPERGE